MGCAKTSRNTSPVSSSDCARGIDVFSVPLDHDTSSHVIRPGIPRLIELVISLLTLVLSAPLWATAAVLVRLTSSGAAFFSQERIGRRGQRFILYKIRTMTDNARGPAITTSGDRRVTRLGRILRKFKIDELPQLWNVVKGDMSLVGPRPEVPEYVRLEDPLWA